MSLGLRLPSARPIGGDRHLVSGNASPGQRPLGHAHFWDRALSRGAFVKTAAGATALAVGAGIGLPLEVEAKRKQALVAPRPIPFGDDFGTGTFFHVRAPGVFHPADDEPSSITDFNGFVGIAFIQGRGRNTLTNQELLFDVDMRFMDGLYVGVDNKHHQGTFAFI